MATKIAAQDLEISSLKARIMLLEDRDKGTAKLSGDDIPIKGSSLETGDEAGVERSTERGTVSVPPIAEVSTVGIPTGSGLVPTVSAIFTTASVVTPYSRCPREISTKDKGKEKIVESDTPKKKKLQEQIDVQMAREMEEQIITPRVFGSLTTQYFRRATWIAQSKALPTIADEPTSALPHDSTPRVTSLDANEGIMQQQLQELTDLCTRLDKGTAKLSGDDIPIKGSSLETGDEAGVERSTERGSNNTEEMVNVLTSVDAVNILT
nr:hypothetical protein [Tanacetum cinerariifolium]